MEDLITKKSPTLVKPVPLRGPAKVPFGTGSSFQPWKNPLEEMSSSATKPCHRLATCSSSIITPEENGNSNHNVIIENQSSEENHTNGNGVATPGAVDNDDKAEMDSRKLKRLLSNRVSAQRSRERRNAYVEDLERKAKAYQEKIEYLHPQIASHKTIVQSLQIEQHKLKLLMAVREKQRVLQEVEIEKNRAEVDRLRKLHKGAALQLRSDSNLHLSSLG